MARARNNVTRLPREIRAIVCELLDGVDGGRTYDDVRNDPDVAAACAELNLTLHNSSLKAYREGPEFDEYRRRHRQWNDKLQRRNIAAELLKRGNGADNIADIATFELLNICLERLDSGDIDPKELRAISGVVAAYERNRISESKETAKRAAAEKEAEYQAEIARLSATITQMNERLTGTKTIDSRKVADELDAALGVR